MSFEASGITIRILDSLSGTAGLSGMEEATVFKIEGARDSDLLHGRWDEGTKHGSFRMLRARERKVVK